MIDLAPLFWCVRRVAITVVGGGSSIAIIRHSFVSCGSLVFAVVLARGLGVVGWRYARGRFVHRFFFHVLVAVCDLYERCRCALSLRPVAMCSCVTVCFPKPAIAGPAGCWNRWP